MYFQKQRVPTQARGQEGSGRRASAGLGGDWRDPSKRGENYFNELGIMDNSDEK